MWCTESTKFWYNRTISIVQWYCVQQHSHLQLCYRIQFNRNVFKSVSIIWELEWWSTILSKYGYDNDASKLYIFPHFTVVDCGTLLVPSGSTGGLTVLTPNTIYNSIATYQCTTIGYELIGSSTRTCASSGSWTGSQPFCQRKIL